MPLPLLPSVFRFLVLMSLVPDPSAHADLVFVGDAMQHQAQLDAARRGKSYDYSGCFSLIDEYVESADYAVVNLETTLGSRNFTGYPCFCSPDSYAEALKKAGFDMMLTANNHTLDRHDSGHRRTIDVLDSLGVDHIGTYRSASERSERIPCVKDINGFRVGFLNYTYGTNGITLSGEGVVDYIDREQMKKDIASTREAGAELVVAAVHWGVEYQLLPHATQKHLADFLVDEGVDMVIGGHPHVIQPIEMRRDSLSGKNALVVYSLGNFISNMRTTDTRGGAMLRVRLCRDSIGAAKVVEASYRLVFTVPPGSGRNNFVLYPAKSDSIPAVWKARAEAFVASAERIFHRHNIGVEEQ